MKRVYDGWIPKNSTGTMQFRKLRFNPVLPIVNINAEFLASKPVRFQIDGNPELTKEANEIWEASGGSEAFMVNAVLGITYGDAVIIPFYHEERKRWIMKWLDASICYPVFDPNNYDKIDLIDYVWCIPDSSGTIIGWKRERWAAGEIRTYTDGETNVAGTVIGSYDPELFDGCPVSWIKNNDVKGQPFGSSDIEPLVELVEVYDHNMISMGEVIDYYRSPNLVFKGVKKTEFVSHSKANVYFVPENGDVRFIEWNGTPIGIDEYLSRVKNQISEISATPEIAFSNFVLKFSDISGIALKVLFGPLLIKTERRRLDWGRGIKKAMRMILYYETGQLIEEENITLLWSSPLPNNTKEDWETATLKEALGVSKDQTLREQGYTEDQINQMKAERKADAEETIRLKALEAKLVGDATPDPTSDPETDPAAKKQADKILRSGK